MGDIYMSKAEFAELDRLLAKCGGGTLRAWVATRINGASSSMVLCGNESMTLTKLFDQVRDAAKQAAGEQALPPLLKLLADWEDQNGTMAAIMAEEWAALFEPVRKACIEQSPRMLRTAFREARAAQAEQPLPVRDEREAFEAEFGAAPESMHPVAWKAWQARAADAAGAQQAAPSGEAVTEFCWLVELFDPITDYSLGRYHTGFTDIGHASRTTQDPLQAKRYGSKAAAERAVAGLFSKVGIWRAVEHGFMAHPAPAPAESVRTNAVPAVDDLLVMAVECGLIRMSQVMSADLQDALMAFAKRLSAAPPPPSQPPSAANEQKGGE